MSEYSIPVAISGLGQPTLPAEGAYGDLEQLWISEQPKNLWPENQNSNLGAIRKTLLSVLQDGLGTLDELSLEAFVATSLAAGYLGRWEAEVGLPVAPTGKTEPARRSLVQGRVVKGEYTRARRNEIIENHLQTTFGAPVELMPGGVPFDAGGIGLFGEGGVVTSLYRVYEDVRNFSYEVRVKDTVDPDFVSLTRELQSIKPAWLTQTISEVANVLDYEKAILNDNPVAYYRLNQSGGVGWNDSSGYGNHLSFTGGAPASVASPGLLTGTVGGTNGGVDFDGVDDYFSGAGNPMLLTLLQTGMFCLEAWVMVDAYEIGSSFPQIISLEGGPILRLDPDIEGNKISAFFNGEPRVTIPASPALGTIHHVVTTFDGRYHRIYDNGVLASTQDRNGVALYGGLNGNIFIGGYAPYFASVKVDEVAIYNYPLSATQILTHYNTGKNTP